MINMPEKTKAFVWTQQLCYLSSSACSVLNIRWRRLCSCLFCVYPQLFNQGTSAHRVGCRRRSNRGLDYSASAKWGRTGLILFALQHLSQLNGPISCLKRGVKKMGRWRQETPMSPLEGTKPEWYQIISYIKFNLARCKFVLLVYLFMIFCASLWKMKLLWKLADVYKHVTVLFHSIAILKHGFVEF